MSTVTDVDAAVLTPDDWTPDRWTVADERSAEHALLRIRMALQDLAARTVTARELVDAHRARLAELEEFIAGEEEKADGTISHFEALLTAWHRRRHAEDPKHCVSIKLSGGVLKSRAGTETVKLRDGVDLDDLVTRAQATGADWAERVPKVNLTKLKKWIKATGEVPEGVEFHQPTEDDRTFRVEVPDVA